jgi:triphosphoribosyl-dephospho-CoA synthase
MFRSATPKVLDKSHAPGSCGRREEKIMAFSPKSDVGLHAQFACIWEATAKKPGNVHPLAAFDDLSFVDFMTSAAAIAAPFAEAQYGTLGNLVLASIKATRQVIATNTNLGIVLLLAPLALAAPADLRGGVENVLSCATVQDAEEIYEAIRFAGPSGLGNVNEQDVANKPTLPLREIMCLAADRDMIARQYANGFREVFDEGVPALQAGLENLGTLEDAIIFCHLSLLSRHPDSLIARKCGKKLAQEAEHRAAEVMEAGWPHSALGRKNIALFDAWLRADGHRRNPGTTADLVTASLFVALREGIITLPLHIPWSNESGRNRHVSR